MSIYEVFYLLGGVGLFLYGMTIMSTGLKNACGDRLKTILEYATRNKVISVLVGISVTMLIQSSSATDVMVIGFVNSGLMNLTQAVGVIMGANIGTTITAQITAFNISAYAPIILFVGAVMHLFFKRNLVKHLGLVIAGFGMLFVGVSMMKSVIAPLAQLPAFVSFISELSNPLVTVLFGVAFTALLQSSSSSTVIFQAFAVEGIISLSTAAYLCIGAAISSVTPNLLASLTANRNGKRTALLNLGFNLLRAALMMGLLAVFPGFLSLIEKLSPGDVGRQVANIHTVFSILSVAVLLPVSDLIVRFTRILLPVKDSENLALEERKLMYMGNTGEMAPAAALSLARKEISRMGDIAFSNLELALHCFFSPDEEKEALVEQTEDTVNFLENAILSKLVELRTPDMHPSDLEQVYRMTLTVSDMERLSDHAENIVEGAALLRGGAQLSADAVKELHTMAHAAMESVALCLEIFRTGAFDRLQEAERLEDQVDTLYNQLIASHIERLMENRCEPRGGVVFTDLVSDLERISDHAINIAQSLCTDPAVTM